MQISQSALFHLCCASFLLGILLALFYDFLYMTRLWLIPHKHCYTVPTIQKLKASRIGAKKSKKVSQKGFQITLFCEDVFFCTASAVAIILLLYWFNNGVFRVISPLCTALGFGLWQIGVSKGVRFVFEWVAFGIETVIYALLLPFKSLLALIIRIHRKTTQKRRYKRLTMQRQNYTQQQFKNIDRAAERLTETWMQKGDRRAKQRKKAV